MEGMECINQKHSYSLESFAIALIILKEFILDFLGLGMIANLAVIFLTLVILAARWRVPLIVYVLAPIYLTLSVFSINQGQDFAILVTNLARLFQVLVYLFFFAYLLRDCSEYFYYLFNKAVTLFNVLLLVNMAVMLFQYFVPGAIVAASTDGMVLSREDAMCGLFGQGSTHAIALYTVFVVLYNSYQNDSGKKTIPVVYNLFLIIASLAISLLNDNKALLFFLPAGLFIYHLLRAVARKESMVLKVLLVIPICILLLVVAYQVVPAFKSFFDSSIVYSIEIAVRAFDINSYVNGSDERFQIIPYAFSLSSTLLLGEGFGAADLYEAGYHGFIHFGQSDFGSISILGGIWTYIFFVLVYTFGSSTRLKSNNHKSLCMVLLILFTFAATVYTQVFSQVRIAIPFMLLLYCLSLAATLGEYSKASSNMQEF